MTAFEKIFAGDALGRRANASRRRSLISPWIARRSSEQLSYNPGVISLYTGKKSRGSTIPSTTLGRRSADHRLDYAPGGPEGSRSASREPRTASSFRTTIGYPRHVSRPFSDATGQTDWLFGETRKLRKAPFDAQLAREEHRRCMTDAQAKIGETVLLNFSFTGFCSVFNKMGLDLYAYFFVDYPPRRRWTSTWRRRWRRNCGTFTRWPTESCRRWS